MPGDDVLGKTNRLFSKLGSGLRKAAKATTGVGLGKLRIELDTQRVAVGASLGGRLKASTDIVLVRP